MHINSSYMNSSIKGILWIGDPHVWSKKPGKRKDTNFLHTVIGKLRQAVTIANNHDLLILIGGDLIDDSADTDATMISMLCDTFLDAKYKPITLVGNHEIKQDVITPDTAIGILKAAKILNLLDNSTAYQLLIDNESVFIGGTPYGYEIPISVPEAINFDHRIWLTHHDLAFGGSYPGALPIQPIENIDILINGHIHKYADPIIFEKMIAFNPGNITRMSIDLRDMKPKVWQWSPSNSQNLVAHEIIHQQNIFDTTGLAVQADVDKKDALKALVVEQSIFINQLKNHTSRDDMQKTDDGVYLQEDILAVEKLYPPKDAVKIAIWDLFKATMDRKYD